MDSSENARLLPRTMSKLEGWLRDRDLHDTSVIAQGFCASAGCCCSRLITAAASAPPSSNNSFIVPPHGLCADLTESTFDLAIRRPDSGGGRGSSARNQF